MNAAARLVHQNVLSRHLLFVYSLNRRQMVTILLAVTVLLSALSIIYVTYSARILHADYQRQLVEHDHLNVERGQLLLERSIWMMQPQIQHLAESKLDMVVPNHQSVVIIHE